VQVPFTLVLTRNRQWLIEQVGIERITHPGRQRYPRLRGAGAFPARHEQSTN
jgi:hypothetical protein